jgi:LPXTG-site transpeptidase (sortase) family protein
VISPVFPQDDDEPKRKPTQDSGYVLRHHNRKGRTIQPISKGLVPPSPAQRHHADDHKVPVAPSKDAAIDMIRSKLDAIYNGEPSAEEEIKEIKQEQKQQPQQPLSKHQAYMAQLSNSGMSLAEIQNAWHAYYAALPDHEKHEVWREFYQNNNQQPTAYTKHVQQVAAAQEQKQQPQPEQPKVPSKLFAEETSAKPAEPRKAVVAEHTLPAIPHKPGRRTAEATAKIKKKITDKVALSASAQEKAKEHLKSLAFGIGTGVIVLVVFLFGFFNEMIIAPFIQPSRHVGATPIILNNESVAATDTPQVIIPKINVQIPVVYDQESVDEASIQSALENGVVHYSTTVNPGQQGNAAIFGHSSNNIFNKGKYKFAFVLLHELVPGDIFYLTYNKTVYTYKIFDKKVVPPSEVSVLNNVEGKTATAALITCDPPGTSTNRLVVWGEQISPDPSTASTSEPTDNNATTSPVELPSNGPTAWSRFWNWVF